MNRILQIILIAAVLLPLFDVAHAETMEERKQRIMRKYLRERQKITQSGLAVPDAEAEDARVQDSEKYREPQVEFQRQETSAPRPQVPRPVPVVADQNWWSDTNGLSSDPYADPFAKDDSFGSSDRWGQWSSDKQASSRDKATGRTGFWWRQEDDSQADTSQTYDYSSQTDGGASYDYYSPRNSTTGSRYGRTPGLYGRQQQDSGRSGTGLGIYSGRNYGNTTPSSGMLQTSRPTPNTPRDSQTPSSGYTPYKSPYQTDQQRDTGGGQTQQPQQYTRPSPYQNWKNNQKTWDPTSDDAYLNELMRNNRR